jgi:hypothetical protein
MLTLLAMTAMNGGNAKRLSATIFAISVDKKNTGECTGKKRKESLTQLENDDIKNCSYNRQKTSVLIQKFTKSIEYIFNEASTMPKTKAARTQQNKTM